MTLSIKDVLEQVHYLVGIEDGTQVYAQNPSPDADRVDLFDEAGGYIKTVDINVVVEVTSDSTLLIDGVSYFGYIAQQVKFEQTSE